jgi:cytoskeletal protein CcmA (bactofilin family)
MFGHDKGTSAAGRKGSTASSKDGGVTILTAGCHFAGKLYCRGATRIGGTIEGEVIAEGLLIVEEDAVITASVKAEEIVVHGRVEGHINVHRKIEMCSTADVQADVATPNLIVHEGALFNGRTSMKRAVASGEAGTRDGKASKEPKIGRVQGQKTENEGPSADGIAARNPDVSFA